MYIIFHLLSLFFFFNDTATTEIYTLSLHDALPISVVFAKVAEAETVQMAFVSGVAEGAEIGIMRGKPRRSEEHTSELQSRLHLVCRLLLEKKKNNNKDATKMLIDTSTHSEEEL